MLSPRDRERLSFIKPSTLIDFITDIYGMESQIDQRIDELLQDYYDPKTIDSLSFGIAELAAADQEHWEPNALIATINQLTYNILSLKPSQPFGCLQLFMQLLQTANSVLSRFDYQPNIFQEYQQIAKLWLDTAQSCYTIDKQRASSDFLPTNPINDCWQEGIKALADQDEVGVTEQMLSRVGKVLPKANILALLHSYQEDLSKISAKSSTAKSRFSDKTTLLKKRIEALAAATNDAAVFEETFLELYAKSGLSNLDLAVMLQFFYQHDIFDRAIYYLNEVWSATNKAGQLARLDWLTKIYGKQDAQAHKLATMEEAFNLDPTPKRLQAILQTVAPQKRDQWQQHALMIAKNHQDIVQKLLLLFALDETKLADNTAVREQDSLQNTSEAQLQLLLSQVPRPAYLTQVVIYRSLLSQVLNASSQNFDEEKARWYYQQLQLLDEAMAAQLIGYEAIMDHDSFASSLKREHEHWRQMTF